MAYSQAMPVFFPSPPSAQLKYEGERLSDQLTSVFWLMLMMSSRRMAEPLLNAILNGVVKVSVDE
jgi:hypothetical protein